LSAECDRPSLDCHAEKSTNGAGPKNERALPSNSGQQTGLTSIVVKAVFLHLDYLSLNPAKTSSVAQESHLAKLALMLQEKSYHTNGPI